MNATQLEARRAKIVRDRRVSPLRVYASCCAATLITAVVFLPALNNGFLEWDDQVAFVSNAAYRGLSLIQLEWMWTTFHMAIYRPLTWMTYGADFLVWGMDPYGYHLTSLLLHLINTALVFALARRLLTMSNATQRSTTDVRSAIICGVAALLFGIHPTRVETVAWVSARADVLATVFALLTLLTYLRAQSHNRTVEVASHQCGWWIIAVACYAASLLSKPLALTLPAVLLVLDVYPLRRLEWRAGRLRAIHSGDRPLLEKLPFALISAALLPVILMAKADAMIPIIGSRPLLTLALAIFAPVFHLAITVFPVGLSPLYELPSTIVVSTPPFLLSALAFACITFITIRRREQSPALLAAWICYLLLITPTAGLIPNGTQIAADRYTYLACIPWVVLAAAGLERVVTPHLVFRPVALVSTTLVLALLGSTTRMLLGVWHDTEALWQRALDVSPTSASAHNNLGILLAQRGDLDQGLAHLEQSVKLDPRSVDRQTTLGSLLFAVGRTDEARERMDAALARVPDLAIGYHTLGSQLLSQGQFPEARVYLEKALALAADDAQIHNELGAVLSREGDIDAAVRHLEAAIDLRPDFPEAHNNLAECYALRGDVEAAAREYIAALRGNPAAAADIHTNFGDLLRQAGREQAAREQYRLALDLDPNHSRALAATHRG